MIDAHIHLNSEVYNEDIDEVIKSAKDNGVTKVVQIGCDLESIYQSVDLVKKYPEFMELAIGWHPVDVRFYNETNKEKLINVLKSEKVIAIGEIGLDYHWYPEEKDQQKKLFKEMIEIAQEYDLPIIIHCREAFEDCYNILKEYAPIKGVFHSFSEDFKSAQKVLELGLDISLSGPVTFKNGHNQKDTAKQCPLERLHIETDGPYLTPVPFRGKRNKPENIYYVAQEIAFLKGISVEDVLKQTELNTKKLFTI